MNRGYSYEGETARGMTYLSSTLPKQPQIRVHSSRLPRKIYRPDRVFVMPQKESKSKSKKSSKASGSISSKASTRSTYSTKSKQSKDKYKRGGRSVTDSISQASQLTSQDAMSVDLTDFDQLEIWMNWRKRVNQEIAHDLLTNTYHDIKTLDDHQRTKIFNKSGVYQYGITVDQATALPEIDFMNYGMPRARIDKDSLINLLASSMVDTLRVKNEGLPDIDYNTDLLY